ncbi:MAG: hypothetical protein AAFR95_13175 [Bacteroidota bacterium]
MPLSLPSRGFVFPHVGNGDTTIAVLKEDDIVALVDLNHTKKSEDDDDPRMAVIDELIDVLPRDKDDNPYLALFVLTHPDEDHCRGFERLLDEVVIGEIIHTPRIFREYEDNEKLCADAKAFRKEADRRRKRTIEQGGDPGAGDRVRIVGYDDLFQEDKYKDFPEEFRHSAGNTITEVDGNDVSDVYEMFVHAPLRDEHAGERNDSSLAFQMVLKSDNGTQLKGLFFGDRTAEKVWRVIDETRKHDNDKEGRLEWHVLLTPHHCSKYGLFEKDDDGNLQPREDVIDALDDGALTDEGAWCVASCKAVDDDGNSAFTDDDGDLPPHSKARERYESMVESVDDFLCTGEEPDTDAPEPIVFEVVDDGIRRVEEATEEDDEQASENEATTSKAGWGAPAIISPARPSRRTIEHG